MAVRSLGSKTFAYPMPVFIIGTYGEDGTPNAMNAAWGGISNEGRISICVDRSHKTAANAVKKGAFTVSIGEASQATACDYVGIVSGNKVADKVSRSGLHAVRSDKVDAPRFEELRMCLHCRMVSYDEGSSELLVGDIVDITADDSILTDGRVDPAKLRPLAFDPVNHAYLELGNAVAAAFSEGKKLCRSFNQHN